MHVFIVYCHPSEDSFTRHVRNEFIRGIQSAGNTYEISDLYKMNFQTDMSEAEYLRESSYNDKLPLNEDVIAEHGKINRCDIIAFIYPVFWTEAPAKLVGWFNRVWTYGFAYGERKMKKLKKAIFLVIAGHTLEHLKEYGHYDAIKTIMLGDRIFDRAETKEMIILDGTTKFNHELRQANWDKHLETSFEIGKCL